MFTDIKPAKTVKELEPAANELLANIRKTSGFSNRTNPLVAPIHATWRDIQQDDESDPDLRLCLSAPEAFVARVAPDLSDKERGRVLRVLGNVVGVYMGTEEDTFGIQKVSKKGRFAQNRQPSLGEGWVKTESTEWQDTYVKEEVIQEVKNAPPIDLSVLGFHATTSATLRDISQEGALLSSKRVLDSGKQLRNGELLGSDRVHDNVFVYTDKIAGSYGMPRWFDQFEIEFGVYIREQERFLEKYGKTLEGGGSDGLEIGDEVPLNNVKLIASHSVNLDQVRKWAQENCPSAQVVSREALKLKYGK